MAQLSTDTMVYSQIISLVEEFVNEYSRAKNTSPEKFNQAYQKVLFEIQNKIGGISFDVNLLYKGDVPRSSDFNKMVSMISKDINIMTNQLESMSANYVNTFNVFSNKIESEKNFVSRIKSKINILEMYSQSPLVDTSFIGDSFDDMSNIDATKIQPGLFPDVTDGYCALSRISSKKVQSSVRVINENYNAAISNQVSFADVSNGLKGSHFLFYKDGTQSQFLYEKTSSSIRTNESAVLDDNPATFFEYEAIRVTQNDDIKRPLYEFQYFDGSKYINWSDFDTSKPLKLTLEFFLQNIGGESINYFSVTPFFGDDINNSSSVNSNVKITSVKLFNEKENKTYEIINNGPIYIASDVSQKNLDNYKNFYLNKAVLRFNEVKVNKIYVTFEQPSFKDVKIRHTYWKPYELGKQVKWNNQARFEPESITNSNNKNSNWDKSIVTPNINRPSEHKSGPSTNKQIFVTFDSQVSGDTKWQVKLSAPKRYAPGQSGPAVMEEFFWYKKDANYNVDLFTERSLANAYQDSAGMEGIRQRLIKFPSTAACVFVDPTKDDPISSSLIKIETVQVTSSVATVVTTSPHNLYVNDVVYIRLSSENVNINAMYEVTAVSGTNQFQFSIPSISTLGLTNVEKEFPFCVRVINTVTEQNCQVVKVVDQIIKNQTEQVVLERNFEELSAKRASIGIRDISFGKDMFQNSAQIISKPFLLTGNPDLITLNAVDFVPSESGTSIKYYISVDGGNIFNEIQPIERNYTGGYEVFAFNQNLSDDSKIPRVKYLNNGKDPGIPNPINSVVVKIVMSKSRSVNSTPVVYYYKLGIRYR